MGQTYEKEIEGEDDVGASDLIADEEVGGVEGHIVHNHSQRGGYYILQAGEGEEEPEAEEKFSGEEVEEAYGGEGTINWSIEDIGPGAGSEMLIEIILEGDFREGRDEFLYSIIVEDEKGYGEANPGEAIGKEGSCLLIPCEFKRELDEGKGEFLVINPLAAEEGCEAEESKIDEENQNYPGEKGNLPFPHPMHPSAPREGALVEFLGYLLLC